MDFFNITIEGKPCQAKEGENVLEVAHRNGIEIPALCYHCDLHPHESCRLCMVEIEGQKGYKASCGLSAKPGMIVRYQTEELRKLLRINIELLFAQHKGKCDTCLKKLDCKLRYLAGELIFDDKYSNRKIGKAKYQFGPSIQFDPEKCINCEDCSEMCKRQTNGGFIRPREGKYNFEVTPSREQKHDCVYCGQCVVHCPVGALTEVEHYKQVQALLRDKTKKVVFQFAPAIRTSIGEEFGMEPGSITTGQIFAALGKIGAYQSFDTGFAADLTIMEESGELVEKILKNDNSVMFTSCCPAWVKYVEFYEQDFIKHLASSRSPQIMQGGLIKTYWAKKQKIDPEEIVVVSIMPCTAKKFEATRKELNVDSMPPVDFVLTTREFAKLLRENGIDLSTIEPDKTPRDLIGDTSGAGEIFGASGGVLEAAIRTAYYKIVGKNLKELEFKELHDNNGIKVLDLEVAGKKLRFAAVNGMDNAKKVLYELKNDPTAYNAVEVMACPGGCIGGGGQPLPTDNEIRRKRANGLYKSDRDRAIRYSHENPGIDVIYKKFLTTHANRKKVCHTTYKPRKKGKITKSY